MKKTSKLIVAVLALGAGAFAAGGLEFISRPALIVVPVLSSPPTKTPTPTPKCDVGQEVLRADPELDQAKLKVGSADIVYTENRNGAEVEFHDPEKQIALRVLDTVTCQRQIVLITKRGNQLSAPSGWEIEAVTRANGIQWNNWATEYQITRPTHEIVIRNLYPFIKDDGSVTFINYVGYNRDLHLPFLINAGRTYMLELASRAGDQLRQAKVPSRALPDKLVVDTPVAQVAWLARLGPTEYMDLSEFVLDQDWALEQALIRIGSNQDRFGANTCNRAGACGLMQFTEGSYRELRQAYPLAQLMADFAAGAQDSLNAMKAAYLHHDQALAALIKNFGPEITRDPAILEELVGAAYNAGSGRAVSNYQAALDKKTKDWITALPICERGGQPGCIPRETIGYVEKLRYIRGVWDNL